MKNTDKQFVKEKQSDKKSNRQDKLIKNWTTPIWLGTIVLYTRRFEKKSNWWAFETLCNFVFPTFLYRSRKDQFEPLERYRREFHKSSNNKFV